MSGALYMLRYSMPTGSPSSITTTTSTAGASVLCLLLFRVVRPACPWQDSDPLG